MKSFRQRNFVDTLIGRTHNQLLMSVKKKKSLVKTKINYVYKQKTSPQYSAKKIEPKKEKKNKEHT